MDKLCSDIDASPGFTPLEVCPYPGGDIGIHEDGARNDVAFVRGGEQARVYADLFKAAPDLYAALAKAEATIDQYAGRSGGAAAYLARYAEEAASELQGLLVEARAALALARGA